MFDNHMFDIIKKKTTYKMFIKKINININCDLLSSFQNKLKEITIDINKKHKYIKFVLIRIIVAPV
jgi:hypothetical protein